MQNKKCHSCGVEKQTLAFNRHTKRKDGLQTQCKECTRNGYRSYYQRNKQKVVKAVSEYRHKNADKIKEYSKQWFRQNQPRIKKTQTKRYKTPASKFSFLKTCAKKRRIEVKITLAQYTQIIQKRICYYCDYNFSHQIGGNLNRIDSSKGYEFGNVKPCCTICNSIMNRFTVDELKFRLLKIFRRLK